MEDTDDVSAALALCRFPSRPRQCVSLARYQCTPAAPKAFALLQYLVVHAGRLVTKEELLDACWPETAVSDGVLKVHIGELRKALGETGRTPRFIATVHRRGYRFVAPVTAAGPRRVHAPLPPFLP